MYSLTTLSESEAQMVGSIVRNETIRARKALAREVANLEYQRENSHIFLKDGTINATEKKITSLEMRLETATKLLEMISR